MSGDYLYFPEKQHRCQRPTLNGQFSRVLPDAIWRCECGLTWLCYNNTHGLRWKQLRWYHFKAKRTLNDD